MPRRDLSFEEDVIDRLARIEERIAPLPALEARIDSLERQRTYIAGAAGVVAAFTAAVFHFIPSILKVHNGF